MVTDAGSLVQWAMPVSIYPMGNHLAHISILQREVIQERV